MARSVLLIVIGIVLETVQAGCVAAIPPSRLQAYVGAYTTPTQTPLSPLLYQSSRTGLLVIADQTATGAAPVLPNEAQARLTEQLKEQVMQSIPLAVETLILAEGLQPKGELSPLLELAKVHDVDYLLVVVASATEQEYPQTVFLGWDTHRQPGLRRDNWSLLEAALIDVRRGMVLLRGEGRSMATLDRPIVPGINQWYPVIWFRPAAPDGRRWWPPTYEGSPITLRVVAMNDAVKRLALDLQQTWLEFQHQLFVSSRY